MPPVAMQLPPKPPTAKRSPSILVTDARNNPGRSAPFAGASGRRFQAATGRPSLSPRGSTSRVTQIPNNGSFSNDLDNSISGRASLDESSSSRPRQAQNMSHSQSFPGPQSKQQQHSQRIKNFPSSSSTSTGLSGKFGRISIDKILSDVSEIPSSQRRALSGHYSNDLSSHRAHHHSMGPGTGPSHLTSIPGGAINSPIHGHNNPTSNGSSGPLSPSYRSITPGRKTIPPRLTQNLPPRTTKVSEKLVLIPESPQPAFQFDDDDSEDAPPVEDSEEMSENRKTYAERLPKERRTDKFPRVTAYCISESIRIGAAAKFLRENHKIRPRIYNEALYAPYYLPLLPGDDENRVKSSPGSILLMEQMMNHSEQLDHHYEYYSGLEGSREEGQGISESQVQGSGGEDLLDIDTSPNFDPSEPQDFSPPNNFLEESIQALRNGTSDIPQHQNNNQQDTSGSQLIDLEDSERASNPESDDLLRTEEKKDKNTQPGRSIHADLTTVLGHGGSINHGHQDGEEIESGNQDVTKPNYSSHGASTLDSQSSTAIDESELPRYSGSAIEDDCEEDKKEGTHVVTQTTSIDSASSPIRPVSSGSSAKKTLDTADTSQHAEIFIFTYGVLVFWNFSEYQEKEILADLTFARVADVAPSAALLDDSDEDTDNDGHINTSLIPKSLIVRPIPQEAIETEELHFTYSPNTLKPRIYNDMITLRSGDHMIKLSMSHALAQSTKLSRFEARMDDNMHDVRHVPKVLALTGQLGLKREEVLKISGKLFKLRVDVNLSSNVLDTPDFFWEDEPSLNPLYTAVREYLEIEQRILVLNERCKVFLELTEILTDSIAEYNMSRITWIIIILIMLSLAVSTLEIAVRFLILRDNRESHHQFKSID